MPKLIVCPKCGSSQWRCYDEHDEAFLYLPTGEEFCFPVGYLVCLDCKFPYTDCQELANSDDPENFISLEDYYGRE